MKRTEEIIYPASYYLRAFKQLDKAGQCDFNCAAAAFGPFWMLYRKMYRWSLLVVLSLSFNHLSFFKMAENFNYFVGWIVYQVIFTYLYGKYGNRLYYKHVKEKVSQGYHLTEGISATMSAWIVTMIAIFLPVLAFWLIYPIFELIERFLKIETIRNGGYIINIIGFVVFSVILAVYFTFDSIILAKSKRNNKKLNTDISEENIKKYLLLNKSNVYVKVFNILISIMMLAFAYYTIMHWY